MVSIDKPHTKQSKLVTIPVVLFAFTLFAVLLWIFEEETHPVTASSYQPARKPKTSVALEAFFQDKSRVSTVQLENDVAQCPYTSITDLADEERHPVEGKRHMVTPPEGGLNHLVCCQTTKGPLNILVHEKWAPRGAQRFLEMVQTGYFKTGVPLMRCIKGFLCQFGLNNDPKLSKRFKSIIEDDPNWLPEGPKHRKNDNGVARFAIGYMAYAGGGPNTRDNQLIVSLDNVPTLAGGSPWEVPWGELVGKHSFDTLSKMHTGYGEDGPQQGDMWKKGITKHEREKFPLMDYINGCALVDQEIQVV